MFRLDNEARLRQAFRPKDASLLELPPQVSFPLVVLDYLAWSHPAGGRVFLVFAFGKGAPATGIVFDSSQAAAGTGPQLCDFCHLTGVGTGVGLLTARLNSRKRLGVHACVDLSCKVKIEDEASRSGRSSLPLIEKMLERVARFASEGLRIDLSGAGRP